MKIKELKEFIKDLNDDAEICIVNNDQDNCFEVIECRTCEDKTSEDYKNFLDIVVEF